MNTDEHRSNASLFYLCLSVFICGFISLSSLGQNPRLLLDQKDIDELKQKITGPFAAQSPERIDFHGKAIALKSQQGSRVTTIDGQSGGTVITMQSLEGHGTLVQGFTITGGSAPFGAGAYLLGAAPTFRGNVFFNNAQSSGGFGAAIAGFSGSPIIDGNEFVANTCDSQFLSGVLSFVNSSSPQIYNNVIHDNDCRAINMTIPVGPAPVVFTATSV